MNCAVCSTPVPVDTRFCLECGADTTDPGSQPDPDSVYYLAARLKAAVGDRYEIGKQLGVGGMGAVFLATEKKLNRPVAIKVLPPRLSADPMFVARFEREAQNAAALDHPNIIPVYAVEEDEGLHYFVMKYVTGRALDDVINEGPMTQDRAVQIVLDAAAALAHAHKRGVIHRDIKPANIMIDDEDRVVVTDFGISKALAQNTQFTATGQMMGTPNYMSPEQAKGIGDIDGRADQYSLAVVAYNLLSGQEAFDGESLHAVLLKQLYDDPAPLTDIVPDISLGLANAVHRALSKDPDARFSSMEEFANAVRTGAGGGAVEVALARGPNAPDGKRRSDGSGRRVALAGGGIILLTAAAIMGWVALRPSQTPVVAPDGATVVAANAAQSSADSSPATDSLVTEIEAPQNDPTPPAAERDVDPAPLGPAPVTTPTAQPNAPQNGFLTVSTVPWGLVAIDGVEFRNSPFGRHPLPPAEYVITVIRMGYLTLTDTVLITAGNTTTMGGVLIPDTTEVRNR